MPGAMTEDQLAQQTVADYLRDVLGWESVYAYNEETLGTAGLLGRSSEREIVLTRYLRQGLEKVNPGLPLVAYDQAVLQIVQTNVAQSALLTNREKYSLYRDGVLVKYLGPKGKMEATRLRIFDFEQPDRNHFLVVRELWVQGALYRRRPDLIGFVNGIPLVFFELKNVWKDIRRAYNENLSDYKDTVPHLFDNNAFVILSNGIEGRVGAFSSRYEHFFEWKRLIEEEQGVVAMETLLKGMCEKAALLDLFENFILFDESTGKLRKIVARNHQYLGVNRAVEAVRTREGRNGQLGVFWHTQGSGKSYSMVFFAEKVRRKLHGNFTFLVVTDRDDLDTQIYKTFAGCGVVDNDQDRCRAASGDNLAEILAADKPYVFTMIHKFNREVDPTRPYSNRSDIIVLSDEAHRTQYGTLAYNMRNALPNAHYIGFTGTPLFKDDELTRRIFGEYVSTYDFQRAVDDQATVPLYYDNRGEKLAITTTGINERIAEKLESFALDEDQRASLEKELGRDYHIITAQKRLDAIARDFVGHYTARWESGNAMLVCIDKVTAVRMWKMIRGYWQERIAEVKSVVATARDDQEEAMLQRQLAWLESSEIAVVVSEEQNEVAKFRAWDMDIIPHRALIKKGFETVDGKRIDVETAFKDENHPFRVVIVCAMWMTGFDVPSLATLYLDKPLKAHTLMQAIARANRVNEGKNNGLIVDYCGILKNLREALATFTTGGGGEPPQPILPEEELLAELAGALDMVAAFLAERGFRLSDVIQKSGFERNKAIADAKEAVNRSEETRKRFEIMAREVFRKFKACITIMGVGAHKARHDAVDIIYKRLQDDREKADITAVLKELHEVIDAAIEPSSMDRSADEGKTYDISRIDFARLKEEFRKFERKNTAVQCLKDQVEKRLARMIARNPLRTDFHQRYQEIIRDYNQEKDRITIEETFAALLKFVEEMNNEERRAIREGLDDENLALFDLLVKPELGKTEREKLKKVAKDLLQFLKAEKLKADNWREKEATRAEVKTFIYNFLYDDRTGLPMSFYSPDEVKVRTDKVFDHVFRQYPTLGGSVYQATA